MRTTAYAEWGLFALAAALIGGEALGFVLTDGSGAWPVAAAAVAHAAAAVWAWRVKRALLPLAFAVGAVLAWRAEAARKTMLDRARERGADGLPPAYELRVEGDAPAARRTRKGEWRTEFRSRVGAVPVKVALPLKENARAPLAGETWRCRGWLTPPRGGRTRFSEHKLWVVSADDCARVAAARDAGAKGWYAKASERLAAALSIGLEWCPERAGLLHAIVLGRRAAMPPAQKAVFAAAGTIHVFAISGLHVMLVLAILLACARALPGFTTTQKHLLVVPLALAYVLVTGARPSALRAWAMGSVALAAPLFGRRPNALSGWSATALFVYAASPALVFDVGCTLSFAVMLGIVLWVRRASLFPSPFAAVLADRCSRAATAEDPQSARIVRAFASRVQSVLGGVGVSFAAWLAGTPVAALVFSRFTVGGLAANAAVVPLSALVVAFGFCGAACGACGVDAAAAAFNNAAAHCTWAMARVSAAVASWPGASMRIEPWGAGTCVAWYAALLAAYACSSARARSWVRRFFAGRRAHAGL